MGAIDKVITAVTKRFKGKPKGLNDKQITAAKVNSRKQAFDELNAEIEGHQKSKVKKVM